jgi:adhesin transport system outer membrane protein
MATTSVSQGETLQDAVKYMLLSNPEIRAQSYNRMARDKEVRQAKAGYLPTIDLYAGVGVDRQHQPHVETTWPSRAAVSIRQNVFRFFGTQSEVERQEARVRSQAYLLQGNSENLALEATRTYLNVLRSEELYELAKENLVNHQRILDQVKLRSESGIDRRADLDQVMGRMALAQANMVSAQANLVDAETDFQAVIGYIPGSLTKPAGASSALPATMEEAERLAVANNATLKSSKADVEARQAQHAVAKSLFYPSFDVAVDYRWEEHVDTPGYEEGFQAMVSMSYNIFNGGWNKARLAQTALEVNEAEEIQQQVKREVVQSVRLSWEANRASTERVAYLEGYVKSSSSTADAFAAQWNIGRRTMFDLLDTQAEYINAKASLVNAMYDKQIAGYRVLSSMSQLNQFLGTELPEKSRIITAQP